MGTVYTSRWKGEAKLNNVFILVCLSLYHSGYIIGVRLSITSTITQISNSYRSFIKTDTSTRGILFFNTLIFVFFLHNYFFDLCLNILHLLLAYL